MAQQMYCKSCLLQRSWLMLLQKHSYASKLLSRRTLSYLTGSNPTLPAILKKKPHYAMETTTCTTTFTRSLCSESAYDSDDENKRLYGKLELPDSELDWEYLSDPANRAAIKRNIQNRKGVGDIDKLHNLLEKLKSVKESLSVGSYSSDQKVDLNPVDFLQCKKQDRSDIETELCATAFEIPNNTHPDVPVDPDSEGTLLATIGEKKVFDFQPRSVLELGEHLDVLRTSNVSLTTGPRTYYFKGALAMMEQALVKYTMDTLKQHAFKMMSVPDMLYPEIIERCGFKTTGERNQIYRLEPNKYGHVCLAGTGEMPLAGFCMGHGFSWEELPQKLMTVSRCYRAETSTVEEEQGIYRVHQFTKVEMFVVTGQENSADSQTMMDYILNVQKQLFTPLGLHARVLDMPAHDLGAPAYRKYDIEAWMPAKGFWGEISSTSNCTDYQSRRLDIRYWNKEGNLKHCHTLNGTACAIPRIIMAILETHQQKDMTVLIPEVLQPYMDGMKVLKPRHKPIMKPIKYSKGIMKHIRNE